MSNNAGQPRTNFSFITYENEADIKQTPQTRRAVRSHVTRVQHRRNRLSQREAYERLLRGAGNDGDGKHAERDAAIVDSEGEGQPLPGQGTRGRFRASQRAQNQDAGTQDNRIQQLQLSGSGSSTPSAAQLVQATAMERRATRETMLDDPADHMAAILGRLQLDFPTVMVSSFNTPMDHTV